MKLFQDGDDNMCSSLEQVIMDQIEVGRAEGIAEGKAEGKAEGITEGIERANIENARKMLLSHMDISLIVEITSLKKEKVEELLEEMKQSDELK